jgi:hypothetical protein
MKKAKTSKRKRIKWNSGTICKETKKNINAGLLVFQVYRIPSMVKRSEKTFISFRFEAKQSKIRLFRFALKQNEKSEEKRSEMKIFWKRNKAKIRSINFALVGSEKFEVKAKNNFFSRERAKRMQKRSSF